MKLSREQLIDTIAKVCTYAQDHFRDEEGELDNSVHMQAPSYIVACYLAQNTKHGEEGVDWSIVYKALNRRPCVTEEAWQFRAAVLVDYFNGLSLSSGERDLNWL